MSTVLGHVVGTDVDGGCGGFLNELDAGGLAVGTGDTVGLAFGGFDDQEDAAVVGEAWSSLKVKVSHSHTMVAEEGFSTPRRVGGTRTGCPPQATIQ